MPSLDERIAYLEGRMEDHTTLMGDIRTEMRDLRSEMNRRFDRVDLKFTWLVGMLVGVLLAIVGLALQVARL